MPLHDRESVRSSLDDCVYAGGRPGQGRRQSTASRTAEMDTEDAFAVVADELLLDGNSRQNLATFCQTWEEPAVHKLMDLAIDKNMIDKDEYPQTAELETSLCAHARRPVERAGGGQHRRGLDDRIVARPACSAGWPRNGGGGRSGRRPESPPTDRTWSAVRCRSCGTSSPSTGTSRCARCRCPRGTTPWTPTTCWRASTRTRSWWCRRSGSLTPAPMSWCGRSPTHWTKLQADTGLDIDIHVDGASGAFLAPFCAPDVEWDFRVPRVKSISTSGHKFGLAPLGVGWVVWRDAAELPDDLVFHVSYLGGDMQVFQINFSRPAGQIAAQYYDFIRLGREGYRRVHMASYDTGAVPRRGDRQTRAVRAGLRQRPADRHPVGGLEAHGRRGSRLHPLRPRRPAADQGLAGPGVSRSRAKCPTSRCSESWSGKA